MAFSQNNNAATGGLKPAGDYETIITGIEERTNKNGKTSLNFKLIIRNDVDGQKYGNACLFFTIWKLREPTEADLSVNGYSYGTLMGVGKAVKLQDGKSYADLTEYCNDLVGKCVIAHVIHDTYNDVTREKVQYLAETKHADCKHKFKEPAVTGETVAAPKAQAFAAGGAVIPPTESDDDYPF